MSLSDWTMVARRMGAGLLYVPKLTSDPLENLGTVALANGELKNGAALGVPGLVPGAAAATLDGSNDYIESGWLTRTNLVPTPNPDLGVNGKWSEVGGFWNSPPSSLTAQKAVADYPPGMISRWRVICAGTTASEGVKLESIPVEKGVQVTYSIWLKGFVGGEKVRIGIGNGTVGTAFKDLTLTSGWNRYSVTFTPTETGNAPIGVAVPVGETRTQTFAFAGVMVEPGSTLGEFFPYPSDLESGAAAFTGTSYESASDCGPFARKSKRTFALLVNRSGTATTDALLGSGDATNTPILRAEAASETVTWFPWRGAGNVAWAGALPAGATKFVVLTVDDVAKTAELFVNGVSMGSKSTELLAFHNPQATLWLGARGAANVDSFGGSMLPFAAFLRVLRGDEIAELYARTAAKPRRRKPSLALDLEIETPEGSHRLPSDSRRASQRPQLQPFSTQRGDGFTTSTVGINRAILKDYPDINLIDNWRYITRAGDIAYEGRLYSDPRTNNPTQQITAQLVGWAASYLKSYKIDPLVVDQRFASWQPPGLARRAALLSLANTLAHYEVSSDFEGLRFDGESGQQIPINATAEVLYDAGPRNAIAKLMYKGTQQNTGNVEAAALFTDDNEALGSAGSTALTIDGVLRTATPAAERFGMLRAHATATHTPAAGAAFARTFEQLAVYGNTGLATHALAGEPDGIYLWDLIAYILQSFYPKITLAGQRNNFPVTQADWRDNKSFGYDIIQQLNNLVLWETNVFEDRTLHFEPADLTKYDWVFRTDDPGVEVVFQGDSIEDFANGIEITYTGFGGVKQTLYPEDHFELRDDSEENPANRHKEKLYIEKEVTWRCSEAEALQIGRAYLREFNRPKRPGTYRIAGYVKDDARNEHAGHEVRNSQTVGILDHPDDEPRLITAGTWDPQSEVLEVTVDAPPKTLEAMVARQELARQARNLTG